VGGSFELDVDIVKAAEREKIPVFIVRTKVDVDIENDRHKFRTKTYQQLYGAYREKVV